jgi:ribosomal protein S12 methylthiotransferase accessory factor YcaO
VDRSRRMVPIKSLMEALECLAYHDANHGAQSRSGMAAHFDLRQAKVKAYLELIERDAFLFHWLSEIPGVRVDWRKYRDRTGNLSLIPESESGALRIIQLQAADPEVHVCMAVSQVPGRGCWHVGLGTERDLGEALAKSTRDGRGLPARCFRSRATKHFCRSSHLFGATADQRARRPSDLRKGNPSGACAKP